jgi:hypothetical protein
MQTGVWMAYSCSVHFSYQLSYIKHFISSCTLEDMNFATLTYFLQFFHENRENWQGFSHPSNSQAGPDGADWALTQQAGADFCHRRRS